MSDLLLATESLSKRFGRVVAVDAVSLHVRRGDVYGFLGLNGAGKTTTLRMALGLARPSAGRVLLFGRDLRRAPPELFARIGALIETPAFYPHLSARANLRLAARPAGPAATASIEEVLAAVSLSDTGRAPAGTFSLGMRQRLGIASALLGWPELVVLDEPTNGLDPRGIQDVRALIARLHRERGMSFLVSSHLLSEVESVCTRVGILHQGRLLCEGAVDELLGGEIAAYELALDRPDEALEALGTAGLTAAREGDRLLVSMARARAAEVNRTLVGLGFQVEALTPRRRRLEDLFLELTRGARAS